MQVSENRFDVRGIENRRQTFGHNPQHIAQQHGPPTPRGNSLFEHPHRLAQRITQPQALSRPPPRHVAYLLKAPVANGKDEAVDEDVRAPRLGEGVDRGSDVFGELCEGEGS